MTTHTRVENEDRLQAYRLELVSRIVDDLAHEIRNPLHALIINLEVMKRRIASGASDSALERADVIEQELQRVHGTVDRLIRLIRPDGDASKLAGVALVLDEVGPLLAMQARIAGRGFEIAVADAHACVAVRPDPLRYALLALAECVLDRLADGGTLRVASSNDGAEHVIAVNGDGIADGSGTTEDDVASALAFANDVLRSAGGRVFRLPADAPAIAFAIRVPRTGTA